MTAERDLSYAAVLARRGAIMQASLGMDYATYERTPLAFDYEAMLADTGYALDEIAAIQAQTKVGNTPLVELPNLTDAVRRLAGPGLGALILLKDEAANASGSFKARRASISCYEAARRGYPGVATATSGNYGAAVASQAAMRRLRCIVLQEVFDSAGVGQPEIVEKSRACEAYGAEVQRLSVGPELFYQMLVTLEETGFFNASLYTPFGIRGVETLGAEIGREVLARYGRAPDAVIVTHAGGGNLTGTARGLRQVDGYVEPQIVAISVDLDGLHMASDRDFNRKSFTTGHTGFGVPFATWPDRTDVPRNAARSLRYMDRYHLVTQGEVFYVTELLAKLEGIERGPAGNTSLTSAIAVAAQLPREAIVVVQESEYTGAGKHHHRQLSFARERGIEVRVGDPRTSVPGQSIVLPERLEQVTGAEQDMAALRRSYLHNAAAAHPVAAWADVDWAYVAAETNTDEAWVRAEASQLGADRKEQS